MSKRCKLQKEYYKEYGNYKGSGKYTDHYVKWLENKVLAINYTRCCETLKDNKITFHEFTREFCIRTENDLWLYKGIKYNDLELDLVYKQYINELNL